MKLSVIVSFFNVEKYIEKCAVSLLNQTYQDMEIIFVDDGSEDDSLTILKNVINQYPSKISRIITKKNAGLPQARKTGVENAKGEYIAFADSDDWLEIDFYENCMRYVLKHDCEVYNTGYTIDYSSGKIEEKSKVKNFHLVSSEKYIRLLHDRAIFHSMWSKIFKRDVFKKVIFPKGNFVGEDYSTLVPLTHNVSEGGLIPEWGYHYRMLEFSMGHGAFNDSKRKGFYHFKKIFPYVCKWFPTCKDTIIGFHVAEYMAVVISMARNNEYNQEIISLTQKFIRENFFTFLFLKNFSIKYKASLLPIMCFPKTFSRIYVKIIG